MIAVPKHMSTSLLTCEQCNAHCIDLTMLSFRAARSSNVLSKTIFPSSDRMVVCASWMTAKYAFSTPYDAFTGSTTCKDQKSV